MTGILTLAAADVLAERQRQIEVEGYNAVHDDNNGNGSLIAAAMSYCTVALVGTRTIDVGLMTPDEADDSATRAPEPGLWPWQPRFWKPKGRRRDLVRAGALILAEIERLDRAAQRGEP